MAPTEGRAARLDDLIDKDELQALADALSALAQVPVCFARADGKLITEVDKVHSVCALVAHANDIERPCVGCARRALPKRPVDSWPEASISESYPCPSGLVDFVLPIRTAGDVVGLIATTQLRTGGDSAERVRENLSAAGVGEGAIQALLVETGEVDPTRMPEIQRATAEIARTVAKLAHSRLEAELARDRAEQLMRTDPLTGLENRRQAMAAAAEVLSLAARGGRPFAFTMLDVDHFKSVNDELGHAAGDRVLIGLARLAEATLRPSDRIYRVGGEEFLVVSKETTWEGARRLAERFREALAAHDFGLEDKRHVTASFGIYSWDFAHGDVPGQDDVLRWADEALYEAKRLGRNRVCLASPGPGLRSLEAEAG